MAFLYEILPVFLFFMAFKWYGIYVATLVGMIATFVQMMGQRLWQGSFDKKQVITFIVFLVFGSMTLYFHNPIFVKWKPTIIFSVFALMLLITQRYTPKPLMQRMMEAGLDNKASIPATVWSRINLLWAAFFILMGGINLWVAYQCSNEAWVNFKFYGITSALFVVSILQAIYLMKFMAKDEGKSS